MHYSHLIVVTALFVLPVLVLTLLRINATFVFLSLCVGYVLTQFLGNSTRSFSETFLSHATVSSNIMQLVLLLFPATITSLFMISTVHGMKRVINILPAMAVGSLAVLLVVPLFSPSLTSAVTSTSIWHQAIRLQDLIVGAGACVSLLFLWFQRPHRHHSDHGKKPSIN